MQLERQDDLAIIQIHTGKANAIGPEWLTSLHQLLDQLGDARALLVTGYEGFFSAGLDLPSLLPLDRPAIHAFIDRFNATMLRLFEVPIPVVAAVNGHAVAGGCVLAMQADWRIMTDRACKIGLNEVPLGIGLPTVVVETLRCQVSPATLVPVALEGRLVGPEEALRLGLVHEVVPAAQLLTRALARARELAALPPSATRQVKTSIRRAVSELVRSHQAEDTGRWVATWFSNEGQALLHAAVAKLRKS
jgi:enoyl-CoA hydratase